MKSKKKYNIGDMLIQLGYTIFPAVVIFFLLMKVGFFKKLLGELCATPYLVNKLLITIILGVVVGFLIWLIIIGLNGAYLVSGITKVDETGIRKTYLLHTVCIPWSDVKEFGIGTTTVFDHRWWEYKLNEVPKYYEKVLYFSKKRLPEKIHFPETTVTPGEYTIYPARDYIQVDQGWDILKTLKMQTPENNDWLLYVDYDERTWNDIRSLQPVRKLMMEYVHEYGEEGRECYCVPEDMSTR